VNVNPLMTSPERQRMRLSGSSTNGGKPASHRRWAPRSRGAIGRTQQHPTPVPSADPGDVIPGSSLLADRPDAGDQRLPIGIPHQRPPPLRLFQGPMKMMNAPTAAARRHALTRKRGTVYNSARRAPSQTHRPHTESTLPNPPGRGMGARPRPVDWVHRSFFGARVPCHVGSSLRRSWPGSEAVSEGVRLGRKVRYVCGAVVGYRKIPWETEWGEEGPMGVCIRCILRWR
jgi:hypothetical protein